MKATNTAKGKSFPIVIRLLAALACAVCMAGCSTAVTPSQKVKVDGVYTLDPSDLGIEIVRDAFLIVSARLTSEDGKKRFIFEDVDCDSREALMPIRKSVTFQVIGPTETNANHTIYGLDEEGRRIYQHEWDEDFRAKAKRLIEEMANSKRANVPTLEELGLSPFSLES